MIEWVEGYEAEVERRITSKSQSWKSEVWCCYDDLYKAGRGSGQVWHKKKPIGHPNRVAQKTVIIQSQGLGDLDKHIKCIDETTLLRERSKEMSERISKGWPKG